MSEKCESCATQGPLIEALTRDNQRLRPDLARALEEVADRHELYLAVEARAEKAEARVAELEGEVVDLVAHKAGLTADLDVKMDYATGLRGRVAELEAAARDAAAVFRGYADHHREKARREACDSNEVRIAYEKAVANDEHAERIEKVLGTKESM